MILESLNKTNEPKEIKKTFHGTVVFWGSEIWLEIFAQNRGFIVSKAGKWMNSED